MNKNLARVMISTSLASMTVLALSFASQSEEVKKNSGSTKTNQTPGSVTFEYKGQKTIIRFEPKKGLEKNTAVPPLKSPQKPSPSPANPEKKTSETKIPINLKNTPEVKVSPSPSPSPINSEKPSETKTPISPKSTPEVKVSPSPSPIPVNSEKPSETKTPISPKITPEVKVSPKPSPSEKVEKIKTTETIELENYEFLADYTLSTELLFLALKSICANEPEACKNEDIMEIQAKNLKEEIALKHPVVEQKNSKEQIKLLLKNAKTIKEKLGDQSLQLIPLLSNLKEIKSVLFKGQENTLNEKMKENNELKNAPVALDFQEDKINDENFKQSFNGKLLFVSDLSGNPEIYLKRTDRPEIQKLTDNQSADQMPVWSPDGKKIAFVSDRDGNPEIYVMDADGKNQTRLTENANYDYSPSWSPDGSKIVFVSNRENVQNGKSNLLKMNFKIFVMNEDGSDQVRLSDTSVSDESPRWSPDGEKIVFVSKRDGNTEIYLMNVDGSEQRRLTNSFSNDLHPAWSPDGKRIAFRSDRDGNPELYLMNADGSKQARLTESPAVDEAPCWTADGKKIIFISKRDFTTNEEGNITPEIYVMDDNGNNVHRITINKNEESFPAFTER